MSGLTRGNFGLAEEITARHVNSMADSLLTPKTSWKTFQIKTHRDEVAGLASGKPHELSKLCHVAHLAPSLMKAPD